MGVGLVGAGCFLFPDPAARASQLRVLVAQSWPWAIALFAGLLVLQAFPGRAGRTLVVVLGGLAAAGFGALPPLRASALLGAVPPLVALIGLLLVVRSVPRVRDRSTTVLWSRTVRLRGGWMPARTVVSCAAGDVRFDMRRASLRGGETVVVRMLLADVFLTVPAGWSVRVRSAALAGVAVRDHGGASRSGPELQLELTGLLGCLTVDRR